MNAGSVITNSETKQKIGHVFASSDVMPKFSILNPRYTMTVPDYQMKAGMFDIFSHICEQYFSGTDDVTSDYLSEACSARSSIPAALPSRMPRTMKPAATSCGLLPGP